jgi:hypothetical protein
LRFFHANILNMSATNQFSSFFKQSLSSIIFSVITFVFFTHIPAILTFLGHDYWNVTGIEQPKFPMNLLLWLPNLVNLVLSGVLGYTFIKVYQLSFLIEENQKKSNDLIEEKEQKGIALVKEQSDKIKEMGDAILHLNRVVKDAYIQAWVSGHFDMVGNTENPKGERPITYKFYDAQILSRKGLQISESDFEIMKKWLENRYDLKHKLTDEDRILFQGIFLKEALRNE